jgi:hypothetical protein
VDLVVIHAWFSHQEVYWEQPLFARFMLFELADAEVTFEPGSLPIDVKRVGP